MQIPVTTKQTVSLKSLHRYLQINPPSSSSSVPDKNGGADFPENEIEVELCETCTTILNNFTESFASLEKIQMEVNFWVEGIHRKMSEASSKPELVRNYSSRMTSDPKTLMQFAFVDDLREEIVFKSEKSNFFVQPKQMQPTPTTASYTTAETYSDQILSQEDKYPHTSLSNMINCQLQAPSITTLSNPPTTSLPSVSAAPQQFLSPPLPMIKSVRSLSAVGGIGISTPKQGIRRRLLKPRERKTPKNTSNYSSTTQTVNLQPQSSTVPTSSSAPPQPRHPHHPLQKKGFKCDICKISAFTHLQNLHKHKRTCKETLERRLNKIKAMETDPKLKVSCPSCHLRFTCLGRMERHHKWVHMDERNYTCEICYRLFKTSGHLLNHQESVHSGRKYFCKFCNKQLQNKYKHKYHERDCSLKKVIKIEIQAEDDTN